MSLLRLIVAAVVTVIWAAVWVIAIATNDYTGTASVTPIMLAVVGYLFAREWFEARNGKNAPPPRKKPRRKPQRRR